MSEKKINIEHIAALARLKLAATEKKRLEVDLIKILEYIEQLNSLDTSKVEPTSHVLPIQNVFRDDVKDRSFGNPKHLLKAAPKSHEGHYEVPQIIG